MSASNYPEHGKKVWGAKRPPVSSMPDLAKCEGERSCRRLIETSRLGQGEIFDWWWLKGVGGSEGEGYRNCGDVFSVVDLLLTFLMEQLSHSPR